MARRLDRSGAALCCALETVKAGENAPSGGEEAQTVLSMGCAVLKDGALAGYLSPDEARGVQLLRGQPGEALYVLPDGRGGEVTVELRSGGAELSAMASTDDAPALEARITLRAGIVESSDATPFPPEELSRLEQSLSEAARAQAEGALERSAAWDADFLELRRGALASCPGRSAPLSALRWRVTVEAVIERSYDIQGGAHGGEEAGHA